MPCDALTYSFVAAELNEKLSGGRIDKITMPTNDEIILLIRTQGRNHSLIMSTGKYSRLHITTQNKPSPLTAFSFCMNLRKNIGGGIIESVYSVNNERTIFVNIAFKNELGVREDKSLICEIMGKYSNVILTDKNGRIYECMRHIGMDTSAKRVILPGMQFTPLTQDKLSPTDYDALVKADFKVDNLLSVVKGLAPISINEAVTNSGVSNKGILSDDEKSRIAVELGLLYTSPVKPCVGDDCFIRPYNCAGGSLKFFDSVNEAMDYFYTAKDTASTFENEVKIPRTPVRNALKRASKRLKDLEDKKSVCEGLEQDRIFGELLTANLYKLKGGQKSVVVDNYYSENGEQVEIKLDEQLSPSQNAQRYYKSYQKKKRTLTFSDEQIQKTNNEIEVYQSILDDLDGCESIDELSEITEEIVRLGLIKASKRNKKSKPSRPLSFNIEGFNVLVGRNNVQNERITKAASKNDIWLHIKGYSGSHVIIESAGAVVPDSVILGAAKLACTYSKAGGVRAEIDYTLIKYVHKEAGSPPGKVVFTNHKTLVIGD